jgi:hypothetical protein
MRLRRMSLLLATACLLHATIIDRIAILVADRIIKESDIERDIRVVDFLNQEKLDFTLQSRRTAANRLIDQAIIQREIQVGEYQTPSPAESEKLAAQIQKDRYHSPQVFERGLASYGLTRDRLKAYLLWQLTVLRFIDQRFRPAILVTDDEIEQYYRDHPSEFRQGSSNQPKSLDDARAGIRETVTNERINKQFETWLQNRRRTANIEYREDTLK